MTRRQKIATGVVIAIAVILILLLLRRAPLFMEGGALEPLRSGAVNINVPALAPVNIMRAQLPENILPEFRSRRDPVDCNCPRMGCGDRRQMVFAPTSNLGDMMQNILSGLINTGQMGTITATQTTRGVTRPDFNVWARDPRVISELTTYRGRSDRQWQAAVRAQGYSADFRGYAEFAYYNRPIVRQMISAGRIPDPLSSPFLISAE